MAETQSLSNKEVEDRLSSLPDEILTNILSRTPIHSAAATSALSRRWRHLWTTVTRLTISTDVSQLAGIIDQILGQLSSPVLSDFVLNSSFSLFLLDHADTLESCFRRVLSRNVQNVVVHIQCCSYEEYFWVPACLFDSRFMVNLQLAGTLKFDLPEIRDFVQLPNLKSLKLDYLVDVPLWLGVLVRSCPALEDLDLGFQLDVVDSQFEGSVNLACPKLKSLRIDFKSSRRTERARFYIDAPELRTLEIRDCYSFYYFVQNPSMLVRACVDLRRGDELLEEDEDDDEELLGGEVEYCRNTFEFVRKMSSISTFDLKIESWTNILAYFHSANDGCLPIFCNLTRFETTLNGLGLNVWKDLLLLLQSFPKLKQLKVNMEGDPPVEHNNWSSTNYAPHCLVSTLKTVHISGFYEIKDKLKLLEYILSNASVLEELRLELVHVYTREEREQAYAMGKECQFCTSLFELPRRSATCEVVFSGRYVTASSNTFKNGCLTCQVYPNAR